MTRRAQIICDRCTRELVPGQIGRGATRTQGPVSDLTVSEEGSASTPRIQADICKPCADELRTFLNTVP